MNRWHVRQADYARTHLFNDREVNIVSDIFAIIGTGKRAFHFTVPHPILEEFRFIQRFGVNSFCDGRTFIQFRKKIIFGHVQFFGFKKGA